MRESCSSIVRIVPTGCSLSTCQMAARTSDAIVPGDEEVLSTKVIDGYGS